jgi:CHAT domain-containing protein/Tfp pilus assembly protein PilF
MLANILRTIASDNKTSPVSKYHKTADSLFNKRNYKEAVVYYEKTANFYHLEKNWEQEIICLNGLGNSMRKLREYDKSIKILNKSIELGMTYLDENNINTANAFNIKGRALYSKGDYYQAAYSEKEAIKIWESIQGFNRQRIYRGYNLLGVCNRNTGMYNEALTYYKKALRICGESRDSLNPEMASIMNNITTVYRKTGDYDNALKYCNNAIEITLKRKPVDSVSLAKKYNNLGLIFQDKSEMEQAKKYLIKALAIQLNQSNKNYYEIANIYNNLGMVTRTQGHFDDALSFYNKALTIYRRIYHNNHPDIAMCYSNMGNIFKEKRLFNKALSLYSKALNMRLDFYRQNNPDVANSYLNYGCLYKMTKMYDSALYFLQKAVISNTYQGKVLSCREQLHILNEKADVFIQRYQNISNDTMDLRKAVSTFYSISALSDNLRKSFNTKGSMLSLGKSVSDIFTKAVWTSYILYKETGNPKYIDTAFFFAEKDKANVLAEAILESRSQTYSGILDSLIEQEKQLKVKLNKCDINRKSEIFHKGKRDDLKIQKLEGEFKLLSASYDSLINIFEKNYQNYYQLKYSTAILSANEVRQRLLPGTTLIEYIVSDSLLFIFTISKNNFLLTSVAVDSLNTMIQGLRESLSNLTFNSVSNDRIESYCHFAYRLYENLIKPVEECITGNQLVIIPGGGIGYVPFEVFLTKRVIGPKVNFKNLPYLIRKYTVSYGNSCTIHYDLLNSLSCNATNTFLGFAPFTGNDNVDGSSIGDTLRLLQLKSSKQEVESIEKLVGGSVFEDSMATLQNFLSEAQNYKVLHIATHGLINANHPMESSLYFYPSGRGQDRLMISDLFTLSLNSEMAVLSACNTGFGKLEKGEGILSLARGFSYAGVPGVTMSLWNVNDKSTSIIMESFYKYLEQGFLKNESLRLAKLDYIEQSGNLHAMPFYWGGFVYIGKTNSVSLSKESYLWYWFLLFVLISAGIFIYSKRK